MFNALNGLGAAGQFEKDSKAADNANSALYATFAVVGFFSGSITNKLGIKTAISFGGLGYSVNIAAYLCYNHTMNVGFVLFSGFLLGCCAGVLWSAQGQIMMSYPPEASKGRYIFVFWAIFNLGGVIGSLVIYMLPTGPLNAVTNLFSTRFLWARPSIPTAQAVSPTGCILASWFSPSQVPVSHGH